MSPRRSEPSAARATRDPGAPRRSLLTRLKTASLAAVAALAVLAALLPARVSAWPSQLPANVVPEIWGSFNGPAADFAWLDQETMIIAGRMGRMSLFRNGQKVSDLVDITSRITPMNGDRGIMGIVVDPKFWTGRPYVYVGYTADPQHNGGMNYNMISRFTFKNDKLVDEKNLLGSTCRMDGSYQWDNNCSPMPGNTHAVGTLWMPGDGALWASIGEGNIHDGQFWLELYGYVGTNRALAMDPNFLGGKIIRINPDTGAGLDDNPFCGGGALYSARCKVWAVGLRNPFRCDGTKTTVWCGDVGWYTWESYKQIGRGENAGWPCWEGNQVPPGANPNTEICQRIYRGDNPYNAPVRLNVLHQWNHNGASSAIVGGIQLPSYYPMAGKRLVADYTTGRVWAVGGGSTQTFFVGGEGPTRFSIGPDGWLYYMSLLRGGQVIRLRVKGVTPPVNPTKPKPTTSKKVVKTTTRPPPDPLCTPTGAKKIVVPTCAVAVGKQPMDTIMYVSREGWPSERVRFMQNGMWGPVGLDASVGNKSTNSGRSMGINNQWFISGYGTHAWSKIQLNGNKCCYRFTSSVGVDDEVRRFYGNWAYNVTGEWSVISADTGATLYNSTRALGRPIKLGDNPVSVDVKNLHLHNAITLNAQVPLRINPVSYNDFTPAHLDWAETKMYCGPKAPYTPIITMMTPLPGTRVLPGGKVAFSAKAVAWDGATPIPPSGFLWTVDLVHCQGFLCHTHTPFYTFKGVRSGSFVAVPHDDTRMQYYFYSIVLKVTDRCGNYDIVRRSATMIGFQDKP